MSSSHSDESMEEKSPPTADEQTSREAILAGQIKMGTDELERPISGLFLSGLSAGLDIGFGPLLMAVFLTLGTGAWGEFSLDLLVANAYAMGFIFVIVGRSALFTELTTLASLPVLARRASVGQLGRLWGSVYAGNIVGGVIFAASMVTLAPAYGIADPETFAEIARPLVDHDPEILFMGAVLAGWMMGLLSWLLMAAQDTVSRLLLVWLVTFGIGIGHLPHSIAGNVEVLAGALVSELISPVGYLRFLAIATGGNAVGGVVFVALLKYAHVVRGRP